MTETTIKQDPFDFLFFYEFESGEREEDALLVGDDPTTASPLHLAIGIKDAKQIVIRPISGETTASSSNYHLKLQFDPGILLQPEQITVEGDDWDLTVEGDTILYLLWKKQEEFTLDDSNSLELMLNGVMATLGLSTRASQTNVTLSWEFKRNNITIIDVTVKAPGDTNPYNNSATEILEMIQRQGKANIPLYVGFFSSNRVCNTNNQESNLKLRITNTSESPITFHYDSDATNRSQLIVALEVGNDTVPWALGTADQVKDVVVSIAGDQWNISAPTEVKVGTTVRALEWTISPKSADVPLAPQETVVVDLSKIVTNHPTGTANLYLRYKYVLGYQDGEFICPIEKAPLVFPEKNVGIGTTTPSRKLHVSGGFIKIDSQNEQNQIEFVGGGTIYKDGFQERSQGLRIKPVSEDAGVEIISPEGHHSRLIVRNGKVGISTADPQAKLHVNGGDAIFQGGNVGIGTTSPSGKLHVNGGNAIFQGGNVGIGILNPSVKLHVDGRIKDKTGFVIPVGTIVPYIGSDPPEGWLLCDGREITGDCEELKKVIGGNYVPDLQGRFIVGAGTLVEDDNKESSTYTLKVPGGEARHKLTIKEMPKHDHTNGPNDPYRYILKVDGNNTYEEGNSSPNEPNLLMKDAIKEQGEDQPHQNRPPYYPLNYIIKT